MRCVPMKWTPEVGLMSCLNVRGWFFTHDGDAGVHELPDTLVHIGIVDNIEQRLGWAEYINEDVAVGSIDGIGNGEIGTTISMWEESGSLPETPFQGAVSLPFGDDEFSADSVDPSFRLSMSHTLSDRLGLHYNLRAEWETTGSKGYWQKAVRVMNNISSKQAVLL